MRCLRFVTLATVGAFALAPTMEALTAPSRLPPRLEQYLTTHVKLPANQHAQLLQGQPVARPLEVDPSKEVAVFGAVWIAAPIARYLDAVRDIEQFEKGDNFLVTKRISSPPRLDDFAAMRLQPDDARDLRKCKVGSCAIKISEGTLLRIRREIDWSQPDAAARVEALMRQVALDYVNGYLEGGNARLAAYRDSSRPTFVAHEFATMVQQMPSLTQFLPEVKQYLLDYPRATLPNADSFLYWQEANFGLKPTIRINHLTIANQPAGAVVVSKMLYASHYFWTALELRVLVPDPARGAGFWFVNINRSRSDGLSGLVGTLIRGKVRGEAEKGMLAALKTTKLRMEQR
jgi:hypothetical protein